jgi:hypothetical protein
MTIAPCFGIVFLRTPFRQVGTEPGIFQRLKLNRRVSNTILPEPQ